MKLTTKRGGKRVSLVDELARQLKENVRLQRKNLQLETDLALARSSADEWRDRYLSAKEGAAGVHHPNPLSDHSISGWVATR